MRIIYTRYGWEFSYITKPPVKKIKAKISNYKYSDDIQNELNRILEQESKDIERTCNAIKKHIEDKNGWTTFNDELPCISQEIIILYKGTKYAATYYEETDIFSCTMHKIPTVKIHSLNSITNYTLSATSSLSDMKWCPIPKEV